MTGQRVLATYVLENGWPPTFPHKAVSAAPPFPDVAWLHVDAPPWVPGQKDSIIQGERALRQRGSKRPIQQMALGSQTNKSAVGSPSLPEQASALADDSASANTPAVAKAAQGGIHHASASQPSSDAKAEHAQDSHDGPANALAESRQQQAHDNSKQPQDPGQLQKDLQQPRPVFSRQQSEPYKTPSQIRLESRRKFQHQWAQKHLQLPSGEEAAAEAAQSSMAQEMRVAMKSFREGDDASALRCLQAASEQPPTRLPMLVMMACVQASRDRLQEALSTMKKVHTLLASLPSNSTYADLEALPIPNAGRPLHHAWHGLQFVNIC